jgi:hypothetical protein
VLREPAIKENPMLKKFFEVNFFISNLLVPMVVLALYCGSFAYFSSNFLLEGVNYFFVSRLEKYVLFMTAGMCLTFFIIFKLKKDDKFASKHFANKFYLGDLLLLLLPLTLVVQYIIYNQEILSSVEILYVLVFFVFFSGFYIFAVPAVLGSVISTRTLKILGLAFVFTILSMASLSNYFTWFGKGSLKTQLMFFGGTFLVTWLLYNLNKKEVLYLLITVNFVTNSSIQLLSHHTEADVPSHPVEENRLRSMVEGRIPATTPNIYLLVYDAYVPNETMLGYGIDNSLQEDYLSGQGFKLYPHTYSIGSATIPSMSRVLNASTDYYGDDRRGVSGDGIVQNIVRNLDYKTYGLFFSDYMFRGFGESYDYSIPKISTPPYIELSKSILIGEFRFNIDDIGYTGQTRDKFVEAKQSVFKGISSGENRVFIYMHTNLPSHTQNSGACLPNETDLFQERLKNANSEMRQDLKTIIENDPGAIVIVAGDHGPHLTKNCTGTSGVYDISEISRLDIQDRHATFLAIRWPTEDFAEYDNITVLQDLFPAVFAYLYKDPSILESKIDPVIPIPNLISGTSVRNGIIYGGINDGEPLFLSGK